MLSRPLQPLVVPDVPYPRKHRCSPVRQVTCKVLPPDLAQRTQAWLLVDPQPQNIQRLLAAEDEEQLQRLLGEDLQFGTAGLRALMGPGWARMNTVTVQQTTQGLCQYLQQQEPTRLQQHGVVIGFDGRHQSQEFASLAAAVFTSRGVPVHLFSDMVPTPFVSFGVTLKGAAAGIMITASHNPKGFNGYKIIPPIDAGIVAAIAADRSLWALDAGKAAQQLISDPLPEVRQQYYAKLARLCFRGQQENAGAAKVVYTPLHGVGWCWVQEAFAAFGLPTPHAVPSQAQPDPDFPTVDFPNPEEGRGVWAEALGTADSVGATLVLANDPDADRLAAAEKDPGTGQWRSFSGNEIGVLLANWLLVQRQRLQPDEADTPGRVAMLASTVSSRMLAAMAEAEGFHFEETLTGFKWLGTRALELQAQGYEVLFAYEEAIGFMLGELRDKDGVAAAAVFAEMAADLAAYGLTVSQELSALREAYGFFEYRAGYFAAEAPAVTAAVFAQLRQNGHYAQAIGGIVVQSVRDLGAGIDTAQPGGVPLLPHSPADMAVTYSLAGGGTLTLRASGTEPKLKYYLEVCEEEEADSKAMADRLQVAVSTELVQPERHGMRHVPSLKPYCSI